MLLRFEKALNSPIDIDSLLKEVVRPYEQGNLRS